MNKQYKKEKNRLIYTNRITTLLYSTQKSFCHFLPCQSLLN